MHILVDIGNTNILFGKFDNFNFVEQLRIETKVFDKDISKVDSETYTKIHNFIGNDCSDFFISGVVPDTILILINFMKNFQDLNIVEIDNKYLGNLIKVDVDMPDEVGVDRLINSYAGLNLYNGPLIIIDFGTSLPSSTKEISSKIADTGAVILDAPLGRTPHHAKDGLLNIMASGDKDAFDAVRTILENLGENVFYLGDLGTGHTIKLMNNFFGMTIANAMAEVFAVADAAGVSRQTVYKVISAGPLHSSMMDFISAFGLEGDKSKLEFAIKNAFKDVSYYRLMTQNLGINSIMSESASKALSQANDVGYANAMVCEMIDFFKKHYSSDSI